MSKQIWKFPIIPGLSAVMMPKGAKPLYVDKQRFDSEVWLWALVDTLAEKEERHFLCIGTGHSLDSFTNEGDYLGTVLLHDDEIVVHVFEAH